MSININSEAWCRKAYLNYHCYGNSMNISAEEMGEITKRWESRLTSWQTTVSNDENQYEFDDSDYSSYKENGKKGAQDQTGYEGGGKGKMITRGVGDATFAVAGAAAGTVGKSVANNMANALGVKATKKVTEKGGKTVTKSSTKSVGFVIGCTLGLATGTAYMAKKPNKDGKEACDDMQNVLANTQEALSDTQADMEQMANEIIELADQADQANENANDDIEEQKTEYDMYKASYEALKAKVESGEPLTEEEKVLYQELIKYMSGAAEGINKTQVDTTDLVAGIYDDMGTYQEGYDYAAETMGEAEGLTDYAASFDETTRTMCYVEAAAQGLNAISSGKAAYDAVKFATSGSMIFGATAWAWAFAAMGSAGAAMSVVGAAEQNDWAGQVGTEIDLRKDTQAFNTETMDMYTEEIDAYDGHMTGVEDLELEMPDDVEVPEDTAIPPTTDDGLPEGTPEPIKPDKEDEEK